MTTLFVLRGFVGPGGSGGNPLGVFLHGAAIKEERRQAVALELRFAETVFVDDLARGAIRIFTPGREIPFGGLPTVGTAWLLREVGTPVEVLRPPAGDVPVRYDGEAALIRARATWLPGAMRIVELGSAADVEAHPGQAMGEPWLFIWAWEDEAAGRLRARSFPTDYGILEDEASGLASVVMGDRLGRPLTIHMGSGLRSPSGRTMTAPSRSVGAPRSSRHVSSRSAGRHESSGRLEGSRIQEWYLGRPSWPRRPQGPMWAASSDELSAVEPAMKG